MAHIKNITKTVKSPVQSVYKRKGKFLNIILPIREIEIISAQRKKQPLIFIADPQGNGKLMIVGKSKVGMLADFLGIKRNVFMELIKGRSVATIQAYIDSQPVDRLIKLDASDFESEYKGKKSITTSIFNIATAAHRTVTFTQISSLIKDILGKVEETEINRIKVWTQKISTFQTKMDKFDVLIVIHSGRNTKSNAIKVIVKFRVHSCENSSILANYTAIKRTANWYERLTQTLNFAVEVANSAQELITAGSNKEVTKEEAYAYIDNIKFSIKNAEKIDNIKTALKSRFEYEYSQNKNKFALSQALSFGGTHFLEDQTSARTLEILQESAAQVLLQ